MRSITIAKKLFIGFGAALTLTFIVSIVSLQANSGLSASLDKVIRVNARKQFLAGEINRAASESLSLERAILLRAYMKDQAAVEEYNQDFRNNQVSLHRVIEEFVTLIETAEARRMVDAIQSMQAETQRNHEELMRGLENSQLEAAVKFYTEKAMPRLRDVGQAAERLTEQQSELMAAVVRSPQPATSGRRTIRRGSANQQRGRTGLLLQPVVGAGRLRAGRFARRDFRFH
jgi:CHASE3 domain sensor protein